MPSHRSLPAESIGHLHVPIYSFPRFHGNGFSHSPACRPAWPLSTRDSPLPSPSSLLLPCPSLAASRLQRRARARRVGCADPPAEGPCRHVEPRSMPLVPFPFSRPPQRRPGNARCEGPRRPLRSTVTYSASHPIILRFCLIILRLLHDRLWVTVGCTTSRLLPCTFSCRRPRSPRVERLAAGRALRPASERRVGRCGVIL